VRTGDGRIVYSPGEDAGLRQRIDKPRHLPVFPTSQFAKVNQRHRNVALIV
jgi:hypothetical protein